MSFKELNQETDVSTQLSVVNELIPLTGAFFSGSSAYNKTYLNISSGSFVSGGFFQTVFDGGVSSLSSSALIDYSFGISDSSAFFGTSETFLAVEKNRVYEQMASLLLGSPSSLFSFDGTTYNELFFLLPKRRIVKDEIKKESVSINLQVSSSGTPETLTLTDSGAASSFVIGPSGDEALLYSGSTAVGKVYYGPGIIAFATGVFVPDGNTESIYWSGSSDTDLNQVPITGNIDNVLDGFRNRINQIDFQNQTNLHSTIYFCRAFNNEFNYSTNPTFIDSEGRIVPTSGTDNQTRAYVTSIGLYDINDNLLAVAKLSEPIKKSPDNEVVFRVRLSY